MNQLLLVLLPFFISSFTYCVAETTFIESQIESSRYSVTYILLDDISWSQARQTALLHAAEMAHKKGYAYFTLDSEQEVIVAQSQSKDKSQPSNIFEDLIIENDMGMQSIERKSAPSTITTYPGLRITFTCYRQPPESGDVFDVCEMISCEE